MAIGSLQELIVDTKWNAAYGYIGETTWGTANGAPTHGKFMILEDGFGVDITNATLLSEYKHGSMDPAQVRRIGMDVGGPCNVHLHPQFARAVLDMCLLRLPDDAPAAANENCSYSMYFNTSLESGERETRKILGAKVNTFTISASNDAQELLVSMEMLAKSCEYNTTDWARDQFAPSDPYLFVDGDAFLRAYDVTGDLSPFSPWSPADDWCKATVSGFSIEGNNNLLVGPYKRVVADPDLAYIQSLRSGRLQLNGSFSLEYEKSSIDYDMLENFSHGELVLNFMRPGSTGYTVTADDTYTLQGGSSIRVTGNGANFAQYDVVLLIGQIGSNTISEVHTVKSVDANTVNIYTYGEVLADGVSGRYPFYKDGLIGTEYDHYLRAPFGLRHVWDAATNIKLYNHGMQIWIPTFKITDSPKPGAPPEVQMRTVNFLVQVPDITSKPPGTDSDWASPAGYAANAGFQQIQYQAPSGNDPADDGGYFTDASIS